MLKPNKTNLIGTVLILVSAFVASYISRITTAVLGVSQFVSRNMSGFGSYTGTAGSYQVSGAMRAGNVGLVGTALDYVLLAIFSYVVISFVLEKFGKE